MTIRIDVTTSEDFRAYARRFGRIGAEATAAGVRAATEGLKLEMRQAVARAGLGTRLGNAIGSKAYPPAGPSFGAAGIVFPRGEKAAAIFEGFSSGQEIRAHRNGAKYLAIPIRANLPVLGRGVKVTPAAVEAFFGRPLRWIAQPGKKRGLLVMDETVINSKGRALRNAPKGPRSLRKGARRIRTVAMFVLVPSVNLGKRLDFDALAKRWAARVPALIQRALPGN